MRNLTATSCLTIAVLLGSVGESWGLDAEAGLMINQTGINFLRETFPMFEPHSLWKFLIGLHIFLSFSVLLLAVGIGNKKIGRGSYFLKSTLLTLFLLFANVLFNTVINNNSVSFWILYSEFIFNIVVLFFLYRLLSQRLRDCGKDWGWAFATLIPFVGFLIYVYALFGRSKVLDPEDDDSPNDFSDGKKYPKRSEPTFGKPD
jgi:uncharacterized membrane protein YhaH (DUF805 family)